MTEKNTSITSRTAAEAGWRLSRYNLNVQLPEKGTVAIANLFRGTCAEYGPVDLYLMSVLDEIREDHPIIPRLAKRGVIVNFDELAALDTLGRLSCGFGSAVSLTICPTMGCNFDCSYCFENHYPGRMTAEVQEDVVSLARRLMDAGRTKDLSVTWFGGEPLLAPDIISSLSEKLIALAEEHQAEYYASIVTNGYLLTPENVKILEGARIKKAQVTLDGIGAAHDATRHLANGGATFDRIIANLRQPLPFPVHIRHNVHEGNRDKVEKLRSFVKTLAEETGNQISYYPAPVTGSDTADQRGKMVNVLDQTENCSVDLLQDTQRFTRGRGHYCGTGLLRSVCIDEKGRLQKCWEAVDKEAISFGNAHDWDPMDPLATASAPDNLTKFLNIAAPLDDEECRKCIWLPACAGGCPYQRLFRKRSCVGYRNDPEAYVRGLLARMGKSG